MRFEEFRSKIINKNLDFLKDIKSPQKSKNQLNIIKKKPFSPETNSVKEYKYSSSERAVIRRLKFDFCSKQKNAKSVINFRNF